MSAHTPSDDTERVLLSGTFTQAWSLVVAWALASGMLFAGAGILRAGGREAPLGVLLIILPSLGGLAWWRWGTPLRRVVATRTGLLISRLGGELFIPYTAIEAVRESRYTRARTITVTMRASVGGVRRFAFIPPFRRMRVDDDHPVATELARRLGTSQKG